MTPNSSLRKQHGASRATLGLLAVALLGGAGGWGQEPADTPIEPGVSDRPVEAGGATPAAGIDEQAVGKAIAGGRYGEALELMQSVDSANSTDVFLLRLKAFCQISLERYGSALKTSDRILQLAPSDEYGAFYRAQALAGLDRLAEAAGQLSKVIRDRPNGKARSLVSSQMPEVIVAVESMTEAELAEASGGIESASDGRLDLSFTFGFGYDDNVALVPKTGGRPGGKDSAFSQMELKLDYRLRDQHLDTWPFSVTVGTGFFHSHYFDHGLDDFDYTLLPAHLTLRHETTLGERDVAFEFGGQYRHAWLGGSQFYQSGGLRTAVEYDLTDKLELSLTAEWSRSDFDRMVAFPGFYGRDGDRYGLTTELKAWIFRDRVWLNPGYRWFREDASGSRLENIKRTGYLNLGVYLPSEFQFFTGVSYGNSEYNRYLPVPPRDDEVLTAYVQLRRPVFHPQLMAAVSITHMRSRSNKAFAEYDRNIALVQMTYSF